MSGPKPREGRCPICGEPARAATKPFCSARCADVDLGRWLSGRYAIPPSEEDGESDAPERSGKAPGRSRGAAGQDSEP